MSSPNGIDPSVPPSGPGCAECEAMRRLVVPPATLRTVRPYRLLRRLPRQARDGPHTGHRAPGHPQLRTGRILVLQLPDLRHLRLGPPPGTPREPPRRSAHPRPGGTRPRGLDGTSGIAGGHPPRPAAVNEGRCVRHPLPEPAGSRRGYRPAPADMAGRAGRPTPPDRDRTRRAHRRGHRPRPPHPPHRLTGRPPPAPDS